MMKKLVLILGISISLVSQAELQCNNDLECHKKKINADKKALNQAFEQLTQADKEKITLEAFQQSQILWNQFIKADCQFMNSPMSMALGEGGQVGYYECLDEYYKKRIQQIRAMIKELEKE